MLTPGFSAFELWYENLCIFRIILFPPFQELGKQTTPSLLEDDVSVFTMLHLIIQEKIGGIDMGVSIIGFTRLGFLGV